MGKIVILKQDLWEYTPEINTCNLQRAPGTNRYAPFGAIISSDKKPSGSTVREGTGSYVFQQSSFPSGSAEIFLIAIKGW